MKIEEGKHLSYPFRIGRDGKTVQIQSTEEHLHDELIQLVLTNPGERVYFPEFGGGVRMLVFEGVDKTTESMTKARITQAISRWLGHRITLENLQAEVNESTIAVEIKYRIAGTQDSRVLKFQRSNRI